MSFPRYPKYKDSGVEWLGEVPEHWETPPLYLRYEAVLGKMLDEKRITESLTAIMFGMWMYSGITEVEELPELDITPDEFEPLHFETRRHPYLRRRRGWSHSDLARRTRTVCVSESNPSFAGTFCKRRYEVLLLLHAVCCGNRSVFSAGKPKYDSAPDWEKLRRYRFPTPRLLNNQPSPPFSTARQRRSIGLSQSSGV